MDISQRVNDAVAPFMRRKHAVGLAVGVVQGEDVHCYGFGAMDKSSGVPPDGNTLFEIGSITKVFTTTLLAEMHLRGELKLDDPVSDYLPPSIPRLAKGGVEVTIRHLATHTSGLPRLPKNLGWKNMLSDNPYARYTEGDLLNCVAKVCLNATPGTTMQYSNLAMGLLGHVLATVAQTDYETLVIERICNPLGMDDTAITINDDLIHRLASGHAGGKPVPNWDLPALAGAGALRSTAHDMALFLRANTAPESTPLEKAIELAHTLQVSRRPSFHFAGGAAVLAAISSLGIALLDPFGFGPWSSLSSLLCIAFGWAGARLFKMGLADIALGWQVESPGDHPLLWHDGGTGGYRSYCAIAKESNTAVVLLSNATLWPNPAGHKLITSLIGGSQPSS